MRAASSLTTERLTLRRWREPDRAALAGVNADPVVMATIGPVMTAADTDAMIERIEASFDQHGFGLWCVETHSTGECIGFVGLSIPRFHAAFMPCVEVGWRISSAEWGRGYAPEAARAVLHDGFERVGLDEIVSFTAATNTKSQRVMHKVGLIRREHLDFNHPNLTDDNPLRPHVVYGVTSLEWSTSC